METKQTFSTVYICQFSLKRLAVPEGLAPFNLGISRTFESYAHMKQSRKTERPDLIILDYEIMPDNIHALIQEIKSDYSDTKLLLIGAFNKIAVAQTFIDSGANGYFDLHFAENLSGFGEILLKIKIGTPVIMAAPPTIK